MQFSVDLFALRMAEWGRAAIERRSLGGSGAASLTYGKKQRGPADCAAGPRLVKSISQFPMSLVMQGAGLRSRLFLIFGGEGALAWCS